MVKLSASNPVTCEAQRMRKRRASWIRSAVFAAVFIVLLVGVGVGVALLEANGTIEDPGQLVCDWATRGNCSG